MSENRKKLNVEEDKLLYNLSTAEGRLLDNEALIATLKSSKKLWVEIGEDIERGEITQQ
jgi:hypothetical protein